MTKQTCSGAAMMSARSLSICCWIAITMFGCQPDHSWADEEQGVGRVTLALSDVPADVHCIRVTAVAAGRSMTHDFAAADSGSGGLQLDGLPLGTVKFYGEAFQAACADLGASPSAQWSSAAVDVNVTEGAAAQVNLVLQRSGTGTVNVSFQDTDLGSSSLGCSTGTTEQQSCGTCGSQQRICQDGEWGEWGECSSSGECTPGATEACGTGGQRTCQDGCFWSECTNQTCPAARECEPGSIANCTNSGTRSCSEACTWNECACSTGLVACGDGCFDTNISTAHCGSCDNACQAGQICMTGSCR